MPNSIIARMDQIQGLQPALDSRRVQPLHVVYARNVVFDSLGPKSAFGDEALTHVPLAVPQYTQQVRVRVGSRNRTFTFTGNAVLEWAEDAGGFRVIAVLDRSIEDVPYRVTGCYLNGYIYFAHPSFNILRMESEGFVATYHNPVGIPQTALACCENNGRLCIIDREWFYWSDQSDGSDFTPDFGRAGTQRISDRVGGDPLLIVSYGRGVMVFTTGGIMRSEFTGDQEVYRHKPINTEYSPINSFCVFNVDDNTVVLLDKRGFFSTKGELPVPFTPLFNEFLIQHNRKAAYLYNANTRVQWDEDSRYIYLSYSETDSSALYHRAYVLYPPLDAWGSFDVEHYGIGSFVIGSGQRRGIYGGFIDGRGVARIWTGAPWRYTQVSDSTVYLFRHARNYPVAWNRESTKRVLSSYARATTLAETSSGASLTGRREGYYPYDGVGTLQNGRTGLDSLVRIGLFRFEVGQYPDEMSEITNAIIGSQLDRVATYESSDYNLVPDGTDNEDYESASGAEDFGDDLLNNVNFSFRMISTNDGRSAFITHTPPIQKYFQATRQFAAHTKGIWHIAEFGASVVGDSYHIRLIELNGMPAGRVA